jgi:hypothetical protein
MKSMTRNENEVVKWETQRCCAEETRLRAKTGWVRYFQAEFTFWRQAEILVQRQL